MEGRIGWAVLWDYWDPVPAGDGIYEVTAASVVRLDLPGLPVRVELSVAWGFSVSRGDEPVAGVARCYRAFRLVKSWGRV